MRFKPESAKTRIRAADRTLNHAPRLDLLVRWVFLAVLGLAAAGCDPGIGASGVAKDSAGHPVGGAKVLLNFGGPFAPTSSRPVYEAATDRTGHFVISGIGSQTVLTLKGPGFKEATVNLERRGDYDVAVTLASTNSSDKSEARLVRGPPGSVKR